MGRQPISIDSYRTGNNNNFHKKTFSKLKSILLSILIIISLAIISILHVFFTPTSFVVIDANASINLKVNRWNKIIDASSLSTNGGNILSVSKLKYKDINDGLTLILSTAEEYNYVNSVSNNEQNKQISIFISGNNVDISKFSNLVKSRKLDLQLNENGDDK
jgi:hypothetical protein